jgi:chemotaxis protein methyltransferase CheR
MSAVHHPSMREFEYTRDDFNRLRAMSSSYSGIKVSDEKFDMYYSRLAKRLRQLGMVRFRDYCDLLENNPEYEFTEFINAITTNLTSFFRENHHFEYLRKEVIPELIKRKATHRRLRIWSAGCSTGEEPYSIAITLLENNIDPANWDAKILATDLDTQVLATAATGIYGSDRTGTLSPERLRRWFLRGRGSQSNRVRVKPELSSIVAFKQLNLMGSWQIKGPFDFIFCRNVLIYFDHPTKVRLIGRFANVLSPRGHLFIGHSESLNNVTQSFENLGNTIYRKLPEHP